MPVYIFTDYYYPSNKTSVNRIKYFRKKIKLLDLTPIVISFDVNSKNINSEIENQIIHIPIGHLFFKIFNFFSKREIKIGYRLIHFIYLLIYKSDIYNYLLNFKASKLDFGFSKEDIIITSGPSFSNLKIGYYLQKKYNVKWIIDYRDPWTYCYTPLSFNLISENIKSIIQRSEEVKYLGRANQIITVSNSLKKTFPKKYHHKISVIPNGANTDEMDFSKIISKPSEFSIVYAGTMHDQQFKNNYFFETVKKFIVENNISKSTFKMNFIGAEDSSALKSVINKLDLMQYVNITERLSLEELYNYMYNASLFLHLKYDMHTQIITSKHADYLALQKPILLPETDNGDIAESIINNKAGYVCANKDELYFILQQEYSKFINNKDVRIYREDSFVSSISRNSASEKLINLIYSELYENSVVDHSIGQLTAQPTNGII